MTEASPMLIAHAIAHFDERDDPGFIHAVALAAAHGPGAELVTLHVTRGADEVAQAPSAAALLKHWRLRDEGLPQRVYECPGHDEIADELIAACVSLQPALIVMPTHARTGLSRLIGGSIAEAVARNLALPSLLLPLEGHALVDENTGALDLRRALILGGSQADTQLGLDAAAWFVRAFGAGPTTLTLLHVQDGAACATSHAPDGMQLEIELRKGELGSVASRVAQERNAGLLVMVSHGHDSLRDVLSSSHTEQVLHATGRPLLWVPPQWTPAADRR